MIRSMTGFGKGTAASDKVAVTIEIKSLNHRYSEISVKSPRNLLFLENEVRKQVADGLRRGKVEVFIKLEYLAAPDIQPMLNLPLAASYVELFRTVSRTFAEVEGAIPLSLLLAQKDVVMMREGEMAEPELRPIVAQALEQALLAVEKMRRTEGEATRLDLLGRLQTLTGLLERIVERSPAVPEEWRCKLMERLGRLGGELSFDSQRVAQEVAIFADRCDISEEIVRFRSHLDQFRDLLAVPDPVGRQMDFLTQEINREVNTIGSKSNDAELARLVIALKAELEKIREQIQNIE